MTGDKNVKWMESAKRAAEGLMANSGEYESLSAPPDDRASVGQCSGHCAQSF